MVRKHERMNPPAGTFAVATNGGVIRVHDSCIAGWQKAARADSGGEVHFSRSRIEAPQIAAISKILRDSQLTPDEKKDILRIVQSALSMPSGERKSLIDEALRSLWIKYGLSGFALINRIRSTLGRDE